MTLNIWIVCLGHIFPLFLADIAEYWAEFPGCTVGPCCLSILNITVCICQFLGSHLIFDFCSSWFFSSCFLTRLVKDFLVSKKKGHRIWKLVGSSQQKPPESQNPWATHHAPSWSHFADGEVSLLWAEYLELATKLLLPMSQSAFHLSFGSLQLYSGHAQFGKIIWDNCLNLPKVHERVQSEILNLLWAHRQSSKLLVFPYCQLVAESCLEGMSL